MQKNSGERPGSADLESEVNRVCESGILGRTDTYTSVLRYLCEQTLRDAPVKEIDIAVSALGKATFDPGADSSIRVLIHNLRRKLREYYRDQAGDSPHRLVIPKGTYTLALQSTPAISRHSDRKLFNSLWPWPGLVALLALVIAVQNVHWQFNREGEPELGPAQSRLWLPILNSSRPLVVALGDYYVFGEAGIDGGIHRLIRDFSVDNREDLAVRYWGLPNENRYADIGLTYLPLGTGPALSEIMRLIGRHVDPGRPIVTVPVSSLDLHTIRSSDILYIGYLSGLGKLQEYVFENSKFQVGASYDEIVSVTDGQVYSSAAGAPANLTLPYSDFGLVSTFDGPAGNRILIAAGMRDEALMQVASILVSEAQTANLLSTVPVKETRLSVDALYEVRSINRINLTSRIVSSDTR